MSQQGQELGEAIPPLTPEEQEAILAALKIGAPRELAGAAAGRPDLGLLIMRDPRLAADVDQAEAIAKVTLLEATGRTHPLKVLERVWPEEFGPSAARPLKGDEDDDDLDLD